MNPQLPEQPGELAQQTEVNLRQAILAGGIWIFLGRWAMRSIGIISTVILARLLAPEDFGLVAICVLFVGLAEAIGKEGQSLAIIRRENLNREYMDSAWTASILIGIVLGVAMFALAPVVAAYFNEPRAQLLVHILSIRVFMMGFENIGIALNRKEFKFGKDFNYHVLEKIFPAAVTIGLAFLLHNYWALVIGNIAGYAIAIASSYLVHEYRPRICFKHLREVWSFSGWVVLEGFAFYSTMRVDHMFVPSVGGATQLGHYHVGTEFARMPVVELFMPLDRVLFPAYTRLMHLPGQLANAYINVLSIAAIICIPVSAGFALTAADTVRIIYGEKWIPMIPVVQLIAIASGAVAIISTVTPLLQALGKSRLSSSLVCLQALLLLGGLMIAKSSLAAIADIAWVRLIAVTLTLPVALTCVQMMAHIHYIEMLKVFWRPVIAVAVMTLVLLFVLPQDMTLPVAVRLAVRITAGGAVFAGSLMLLWLAAGKPPGAERALMRFIESRTRTKAV